MWEQAHPNLYPLAGDGRRLTLLKRGCTNSVVGLELAEMGFDVDVRGSGTAKECTEDAEVPIVESAATVIFQEEAIKKLGPGQKISES